MMPLRDGRGLSLGYDALERCAAVTFV